MERRQFKTEVSDLLHLIIHSLYSHKEIFLRELISNASDALDKAKYKMLTEGNGPEGELRIDISFTEGDKRTLTITDNGIGISILVIIVAAFNLLLDFDIIERGAATMAPKYFEWYCSFGLLVTLVWLYIEVLKLLSKLQRR